ncbi:MAG: hypothetical protein KA059_09385, partial [Elusimicrobiales bacterium]|nr:hypothetical protein [Elusimicrobiales bacterium]
EETPSPSGDGSINKMLKKSIFIFLISIFFTEISFAKTVIIPVADLCVKVEKIIDNKIYLKDSNEQCILKDGSLSVSIKDEINAVEIYLNEKLWKVHMVENFNIDEITKLKEKANKEAKKLKELKQTRKNVYQEKGNAEAEKLNKYYTSNDFQSKLKSETERLKSVLKVEEPLLYKKEATTQKKPYYSDYRPSEKPKLQKNERLYIFISSSIPVKILRNYVSVVNKINDENIIFVMRGFINGAKFLKPTARFVLDLLKKDEDCSFLDKKCEIYNVNFIIDPLLFQKYDIQRVPSFVYATNVNPINIGLSEGSSSNLSSDGEYFLLSGDASLEFIIEKFAIESGSPHLKKTY